MVYKSGSVLQLDVVVLKLVVNDGDLTAVD
jgi:hypothetical protein